MIQVISLKGTYPWNPWVAILSLSRIKWHVSLSLSDSDELAQEGAVYGVCLYAKRCVPVAYSCTSRVVHYQRLRLKDFSCK